MTRVLVTGASGFLGRNLIAWLGSRQDVEIAEVDLQTSEAELREGLGKCDLIYHLAGANRPADVADFSRINRDLTATICLTLKAQGRVPKIVFSSSIQAELENPYGVSKREAEAVLRRFSEETGAPVSIYRLKNLFGKWSRPDYNTVVATFCHNIAHDFPIQISNRGHALDLVYVDDVVEAFVRELEPGLTPGVSEMQGSPMPSHTITLGALADTIQSFREMRDTLIVPDFSIPFHRKLYATYLSFVDEGAQETALRIHSDNRGSLAEFLKSDAGGQIFLSRTQPGVTRGNHYHHTKTEKFFVVEGDGLIRMRRIDSQEVVEYRVRGRDYQIVDIPPGCTHSIQNVGSGEMVTLFWASEIFNPDRPDTYFLPVVVEAPPAASGEAQ